jgi:acyl carrier protein
MTRTDLDTALRGIFADMFDAEPASITGDTSPDTLLQWDSLGHIRLIAALEERFETTISPDAQVEMLTFELVGDVLEETLG